ncbi:MAG: hypothetical protein KA116_05000 [Proteobacteria bacterium]|nr:hypothetical protein [Pseudomonadota bacterium]
MRKLLLILAVALSRLVAAGGWVSSGDDGIMCFASRDPKTPEYIKLINHDYETKGYLTKETKALILPKIQELSTLEFWETREAVWIEENKQKPKNSKDKDRDPKLPYNMGIYINAENTEGYLNTLEEDFIQYSPLFHLIYKEFSKKIEIGNFEFDDKLPKVDDSRPRFDLKKYPNCVMVQLAVRKTEDVKGIPSNLSVSIDKELFDKLRDDLNRALVVSHERLYAIAFALGVRNSDSIRILNGELFRTQHWISAIMNPSLPEASMIIVDWLQFLIGDFYKLIPKLESYKRAQEKNTQEYIRFEAFMKLREKQNKIFVECLIYHEKKNPNSKTINFKTLKLCRSFGDDPVRIAPLDEIQSFIFLSQAKHLDQLKVVDLNALTLPSFETFLDFEHQNKDFNTARVIKDYCERIASARDSFKDFLRKEKDPAQHILILKQLYDNALSYCQKNKD